MKKTCLTLLLLTFWLTSHSQERKLQITNQTSMNLAVIDLDISEKFYVSIFGFEALKMPDDNFRTVKRWLKIRDRIEFHLEFGRTKIIETNYKKAIHIFWECPKEKFEKLEDYFKELKIPAIIVKSPDKENGKEPNKIYLNDPDGYVIEIKEVSK